MIRISLYHRFLFPARLASALLLQTEIDHLRKRKCCTNRIVFHSVFICFTATTTVIIVTLLFFFRLLTERVVTGKRCDKE
jgi:acyl-CoA thioesterase FadM